MLCMLFKSYRTGDKGKQLNKEKKQRKHKRNQNKKNQKKPQMILVINIENPQVILLDIYTRLVKCIFVVGHSI